MNPVYFAQYYDNNMMDGGGWGWGIVMMFIMVIVTVLIVALIVRSVHWHAPVSINHDDALDIAKKRYAKGDITNDEFKKLKEDIK
jgi:putative membrane protein